MEEEEVAGSRLSPPSSYTPNPALAAVPFTSTYALDLELQRGRAALHLDVELYQTKLFVNFSPLLFIVRVPHAGAFLAKALL